ncbi:MAG: hypothetical protein QMC67_13700 [Candidatus Wallbacteria bacterium]
MFKLITNYKIKIQKIIDSKPKDTNYTTAKIFPEQWDKYSKLAVNENGKKEAAKNKRNYGRAFTNAVINNEYKNIKYTGKNKQKASTFHIF